MENVQENSDHEYYCTLYDMAWVECQVVFFYGEMLIFFYLQNKTEERTGRTWTVFLECIHNRKIMTFYVCCLLTFPKANVI